MFLSGLERSDNKEAKASRFRLACNEVFLP
jgi:hypothetical protein